MQNSLAEKIITLKGPILVLGAGGFIGANLLRTLLDVCNDVYGTSSSQNTWRLDGIDERHIIFGDLLQDQSLKKILDEVKPQTVFNCVSYGAYSFQSEIDLIYKTNINFAVRLIEELWQRKIDCLINAGSSSEYGDFGAAPDENHLTMANSHYSVTKSAIANLIYFYGKKKNFKCANLRFYSAYGPYEDSSRLVPQLILKGLKQEFPPLVNPNISRDFVYVDDVCAAFIAAACELKPENYGESFNIGSQVKTTISDIALLSKKIFNIKSDPEFSAKSRDWDIENWFSNSSKALKLLGWQCKTSLEDGLQKTAYFIKNNLEIYQGQKATKKPSSDLDVKYSVSIIIACYKDGQAINEMYQRITKTMQETKSDYEIIFVNDNSPDDSEEIITALSERDSKVIGINHSRNFGSQAAFKSGLEIASKNSCVLMDGDLQDPPEMIKDFIAKWKQGYEVVYGKRVSRDAPFYMKIFYKLFYRVFSAFSYIPIPRDAGDFALMDRKVVNCLLKFPERDLFLRGMRAYAGFKQVGVDYVRPERKYGRTTNSFFKNIGWAKKGIFSFSYVPLNMLSAFGWLMLITSFLLIVFQIIAKIIYPNSAPHGVTTTLVLIIFFGSINLFFISILGEYIAKIFEEVKSRPHFIRRSIVRRGNISDLK